MLSLDSYIFQQLKPGVTGCFRVIFGEFGDTLVIPMFVEAERQAVRTLHTKILDTGLLRELKEVAFWLDDVESLFLRSARSEQRTPAQLERWLSYAIGPLSWAMRKRKHLEDIVTKYGSSVVTIG